MKLLPVILLLLASLSAIGQFRYDQSKVSPAVRQIASDIAKNPGILGMTMGEGAIVPSDDRFEGLRKAASDAELITLTNHPNGSVRCLAFWALQINGRVDVLPILLNHIQDTEEISTQFGCLIMQMKVGDFIIDLATSGYPEPDSLKLSDEQIATLDSVLIYTPNKLRSLAAALHRVNPTEKIYPRIRQLAIRHNNQHALVVLAGYRKESDVNAILSNRDKKDRLEPYYFTFLAISRFPHAAFLSYLKTQLVNTFDDAELSSEWTTLYEAIASYKNEKAAELLTLPLTSVRNDLRSYHLEQVFRAIQQFRDPVYDNLLWQLWESENIISDTLFAYLYRKDPARALVISKRNLTGDLDLITDLSPYDSYDYERFPQPMLFAVMIDTLLVADRQAALEIIRKNLATAHGGNFQIFADNAVSIQDASFLIPLYDRLEKDPNAYVVMEAARSLIAYKDPNINKRVKEASQKNPLLKESWPGRQFDELLKKNNIE